MMSKFKKRWLLVVIFFSILSALLFNQHYRDVSAEEVETTEVTPYKKPTGDVRKFLGIWLTSGYALQPADTNYVVVDQSKTLYTDQARSFAITLLAPLHGKNYQWFKSTDGKTWSKVSKADGGEKQNLAVKPTAVGTTYYQQETYWKGLLITSTEIYSKVATVHAIPEPTDATKVDVTTDDDYLYNSSAQDNIVSNTTYARAKVTPENATGDVTWSVDNTNLATIDPNTGLITANTARRKGTVTVTATVNNPIGPDISGSTEILIGEGLEDQTVKAGKTATFSLRGNVGDLDEDDENNYTVRWFKEDPITHHKVQLDLDPKALSYTTPKTTLNDDGTSFQAIITVKIAGKSYSYTTGLAYLYVIPDGGPNLEINNTLTDDDFDDGTNTDTILFGVNNGDTITYHNTLTNISTSGTLKDSTYTLPLKKGTGVSSVKIDGAETTDYKLTDNDVTDSLDLSIPNLIFKINQVHNIEVTTKVSGITRRESFASVPYIQGKDDDNDSYQKVGQSETLNYTTGSIEINKVRDIDYGTINTLGSGQTIKRQDELNLPNNIMEVEDMRRYKLPLKVRVSQTDELKNDNGDVLAGRLRFYDNGKYQDLFENDTVVAESGADEELYSIGWDENNGILLFLESKWNASGTYKTTLNWTIEDSI